MWVILTFLLAVAVIFLEFFLPGGVLGAVGAISLMTSIGLGFYNYGSGWGMVIFVGELAGAGALLAVMMKRFPHTRIGRLMILQTELNSEQGYVGQTAGLEELIGAVGVADSDLRPAGVIRIDGRRIDAVANGMYLEHGTAIEVMQVEGNRVVVRPRPEITSPGQDAAVS